MEFTRRQFLEKGYTLKLIREGGDYNRTTSDYIGTYELTTAHTLEEAEQDLSKIQIGDFGSNYKTCEYKLFCETFEVIPTNKPNTFTMLHRIPSTD